MWLFPIESLSFRCCLRQTQNSKGLAIRLDQKSRSLRTFCTPNFLNLYKGKPRYDPYPRMMTFFQGSRLVDRPSNIAMMRCDFSFLSHIFVTEKENRYIFSDFIIFSNWLEEGKGEKDFRGISIQIQLAISKLH